MNKQRMYRIVHYAVLILLSLATLLPVLWVVLSSFKPQSELFRVPLTFIPQDWTLENYVSSLAAGNFPVYFSNTVFVAVVSTAITVLINLMAGYALAKYIFKGRDIIFTVMIATLMIPLQVIMIPIFLQLKSLGMLNSLWGIIIPPAATPTGVFLARQYLVTLPNSLIEAARIDGAREHTIFFRLILPMSKPIVATIAIFSFMWRWNDYLWPLIVITDNRKQTIQQALANFVGQLQINWSDLLAMTTIAIIPVIIVFLAFQRFFFSGIAAGSVKG
ncbi:carbohydrate ABC transporter permease [Sphaerochaeta sp.]|jgi:alpha-1,4-digalacturonate transport system permease protein|uniref:carbohydrate ABC transporter permease n=1 Tax=Sphaerochaeta sp. TaxID=1972642 RepID=UPI00261BAA5F|nr:carbohydrate ABC transporter permease [Sphaerochaeta sp.]MDX9825553.1 carbohydrate ABC transporter permease [Sphaerochaeta sp.]HPE94234.1 carbohydrate ABC transporter permease [Sphaerochaeta sp.]